MANNLHDDQEALETLFLTDFPLSQYPDTSSSLSSSSSDPSYLFEFFQGELSDKMMPHAEDIIFCGKLLAPINQQRHRTQLPQQSRSSRFESMSLGYKKLKRNSSMSSYISRDGSGKKSSSYLRRHIVSYGLVNVRPKEMNIRDLKNRQLRMNTPKTYTASSESVDVLPVSQSVRHRKCSWKVLELLSCKSSSAAVMIPLGYMAKV